MNKKVLIEEMSWNEFRERMSHTDVVIFPTGSTEGHGKHNPLGTDTMIAAGAARAIGEKTGIPVAPALPIGNAAGLLGYPGTASIDPQLLRELIVASCENLIAHGAKKFLFINGHGGNTNAIREASSDLYTKHGVISTQTEWWTMLNKISEYKPNDHGGYSETSFLMAAHKDAPIDLSKAKDQNTNIDLTENFKFEYGLFFQGIRFPYPVPLHKITEEGYFGDAPIGANIEYGQKMFDVYVDYCAELALELQKVVL